MYSFIKRSFDIAASAAVLTVSSPVMIAACAAVKLSDGGSVFFRQKRPGKDGKIFTVYKFRTMKEQTKDKNGNELSDMERMTKLGSVLRKTSIDELPQFINVLKGDMSIIGPRPLLCEYLPLYNAEQMRRHEVRPGITGWAQVNGRNAISWEEKFRYDVYYVDNMSLVLDIKIIAKTVKNVLMHSDINCSQNDTMEKFTGTPVAEVR